MLYMIVDERNSEMIAIVNQYQEIKPLIIRYMEENDFSNSGVFYVQRFVPGMYNKQKPRNCGIEFINIHNGLFEYTSI